MGGKQSSDNGRASLAYGVSITDGECQHTLSEHGLMAACVDWEMTLDMLDNLNQASLTRREVIAKRA
jgi:3-deoxy-7-phosphoheptulonate synthase